MYKRAHMPTVGVNLKTMAVTFWMLVEEENWNFEKLHTTHNRTFWVFVLHFPS